MKKEDMMKAATLYADDVCKGPRYRWGHEQVAMVDYIEGAKWRINSVWHKNDEMPERNMDSLGSGEDVLVRPKYTNNIELCQSMRDFDEYGIYYLAGERETYLMEDIEIWAYVNDLLPNNKEDER